VGILSTEKYDSLYRMRQPNRTNRQNSILINGSELDTITREEWWTICHDYEEIVLSRTTPQHKLKCVKEFQENNFSVLMVGDGANDVLALKSANISVAMSSGNRIAADISDIVLLDNDFACIYKIILTGKQTLDNVKKIFLHFTVVSAFSQAFTCIISTIFGLPNLFSVYASTIICMITDGIPATTFIFEKSRPKNALEASESEEKNSIKERIVDWRLLIMGCVSRGPLTTLFLYGNFFIYVYYHTNHTVQDFIFNYKNITDPRAVLTMQSISFYSVVVIQCFGNIWAIRSLHVSIFKISPFHGYYRNLPMVISTFIMLLIGIGLICIPTANNLLGTTPIPIGLYFIPFGYAIFIIAMNEFRIFLRDRFNFKEKYFW
jgi:sodium/potassium-transporting ATPase subunit alpha